MKISKIAFIIVCLVSLASYGQTEKGKYLVGVNSNLGFTSSTLEVGNFSNKTTSFNFSPTASYFVIDDLAVGIGLFYGSSKTDDSKTNQISAAPTVKYYFLEGKTRLFAETSYGIGRVNIEADVVDLITGGVTRFEDDQNLSEFQVNAGVALFLNDYISIELALGYFSQKTTDIDNNPFGTDETKSSGFASRIGFAIFL